MNDDYEFGDNTNVLYEAIITICELIHNKNIMSIYSGFSTRQTEEVYNRTLLKMLQLLHNQVLYYIESTEDIKQN
jgi:hypothetical protein